MHTLSVRLKNIVLGSTTSSIAEVVVIIEAEENVQGEQRISLYKATYTVGLENGALKLLKGKAKKIKETM
ncbi:hypothetical protein P4S83_17920 [Aneurinibacillus thermoaerophilus]|uniref:hypothetical protein n=1 Tax=Aneurinibacillus thermoaerophilus TaxID=143495 RepID=UPI002E1EA7F5|nr:hypothetical protein [Aneurinibacillus thermoaerophilus]MED0763315.1 hypothetical protein [Aneurinibacillus thermoaerophilus]